MAEATFGYVPVDGIAHPESSSQVTREQFRLIPYLPEIARDEQGRPLVSADVLVLISLPRRTAEG